MESIDQELIAEFVVESQEGLANVENEMLEIESAGADVDTDLVNAVFRTMHSIKGAAGFLGLDRIQSLAHGLEEILDDLRNCEVIPTSELVTSVLKAADYMAGLIDAVESSHDAEVTPYIEDLQRVRQNAKNGVTETASEEAATPAEETAAQEEPQESPAPAPEPVATVESTEPTEPVVESTPEEPSNSTMDAAVREFLIECFENLDQTEHDIVELEQDPSSENLLRSVFRTVHTIKGGAGFLGLEFLEKLTHIAENLLTEVRNSERAWDTTIASAMLSTVDKCREALGIVENTGSDRGFDASSIIQEILEIQETAPSIPEPTEPTEPTEPASTAKETEKPAPPEPQKKPEATPMSPAATLEKPAAPATKAPEVSSASASKAPTESHPTASESTIRVDVGLLDKLMTRVGELVLARNQILQHTNQLDDTSFISTAQRLNLITTELQEDVMKTRMQPIGNVWAKFPRVVRDLSSQLGKQVRIEMEGKETELDKTIVEAIKDPLTHLVRNSVDHGIESPEDRVAAGKSEEGCLLLRAYHEGGQVNIEITDDGAGLKLEKIRAKAIERGLINNEQANRMTDREISQLILLPGFSTAEQVSSVSGRGVGMDVVKTNIEKIGGTLDLESKEGLGTTINIKIPLTLAIIPALVVTNGGDRYAIPQVSLLELVRLEGEQVKKGIENVHGAPVYRLRGNLLPIVNLSERLNKLGKKANGEDSLEGTEPEEDTVINIVVLRANERQFGLVVDGVLDTEEIVVKPLSRQLKSIGEYAGATIMGDGTVALILDVAGLARAAGLDTEINESSSSANAGHGSGGTGETESLLIVDLGDARRFALPTSMVSRLEKVPANSVEYADGNEVIQYRGDIMPLLRLSQVFHSPLWSGQEEEEEIQIVVYSDEDRTCGLVVNRIVDIVETELQLRPSEDHGDNLLGTTVIQDRVTDVVNVRTLASGVAVPRNAQLLAN